MDELTLYETRGFGSEVVEVGTGQYQTSLDEFHNRAVGDIESTRRDAIYSVEAIMAANSEMNASVMNSCKLVHRFSPGIYTREFSMPAGSVISGQRHAREHIVVVLSGTSDVYTEDGGKETITGPCTFISPAGTKRLLINKTDTIWQTIHRTDATAVEEAENELILNEKEIHNIYLEKAKEFLKTNNLSNEDALKLLK